MALYSLFQGTAMTPLFQEVAMTRLLCLCSASVNAAYLSATPLHLKTPYS